MIVSTPRLALACLLVACGPTAPMNLSDASTSDPGSTTTPISSSSSAATTADPTTSTSTTTGTSEVASSSTPDELTFISPSDFSCLTGSARCTQCDPFTQDCSEGLKCTPWANDGGGSWNSTTCRPVDPDPDQPGEPCTVQDNPASGNDSCDVGSMCWNVDGETLIGTCVPLCTGNPEMAICPEPLGCGVFNEGNLPLCLQKCDPLAQDCPPKETCIVDPTNTGFLCTPDASGDAGQPFDPCEFINTCEPGLSCEASTSASECDPNAIGCCTPFCDLTLPPNCPGAMQTCQPFFKMDPAPPGLENVGICSLP